MPGKPPGPLVLGVLRVLKQHGELSRLEISHLLGVSRFTASAVISRMAKPQKTLPKRVFIRDWVYDADINVPTRVYPRAVYALGDYPDVPKPPPSSGAENSRRWRDRERHRVNSVFMWAQPRKTRVEMRKSLASKFDLP